MSSQSVVILQLIRRKDSSNYIPLKEQLKLAKKNKRRLEKKKEETKKPAKKKKAKKSDPNNRVPPVPAAALAVSKAAAPSATVSKPKKQDKKVKKTASKGTSTPSTTKKVVKRRTVPVTSQNSADRLKRIRRFSPEALKAKDRVEINQRLQGMYDSWTLFYMPATLKSHIKKRSKKTWNVAAAASGKEGLGAINPNARHLICDEQMPEWLAQDEKETLEELEEMIIRDRRQRQARQDAWSRKYSIAKGKTLPPSKFNRPTNKWKKVSPGDKIVSVIAKKDTFLIVSDVVLTRCAVFPRMCIGTMTISTILRMSSNIRRELAIFIYFTRMMEQWNGWT